MGKDNGPVFVTGATYGISPDYDCAKCSLRDGCEAYQEGTWCTRYTTRDQSRSRGESPADKWSRGEEDWDLVGGE